MKYRNVFLILFFIFIQLSVPFVLNEFGITEKISNYNLRAQETTEENINAATTAQNGQEQDRPNVLYTVMAVVLIIWLGMSLYLFKIDRKIKELERELE